jgi:hypothetical protein
LIERHPMQGFGWRLCYLDFFRPSRRTIASIYFFSGRSSHFSIANDAERRIDVTPCEPGKRLRGFMFCGLIGLGVVQSTDLKALEQS